MILRNNNHTTTDLMRVIFIFRTKRMVVDVIRCQERGDNLRQILDTPALEEEENEHQALIRHRDKVDQRAASRKSKLVRQQSVVSDVR